MKSMKELMERDQVIEDMLSETQSVGSNRHHHSGDELSRGGESIESYDHSTHHPHFTISHGGVFQSSLFSSHYNALLENSNNTTTSSVGTSSNKEEVVSDISGDEEESDWSSYNSSDDEDEEVPPPPPPPKKKVQISEELNIDVEGETLQSQIVPPLSPISSPRKQDEESSFGSLPPPPLEPDTKCVNYEMKIHPTTHRQYYIEVTTGQSRWDPPSEGIVKCRFLF